MTVHSRVIFKDKDPLSVSMRRAVLLLLAVLSTATLGQICGNNVIEGGEQCDSGDAVSNDGCSSTCQCEPLDINITIIDWPMRTACQQGDLITVEFQVDAPSWAILGDEWDIECDAGDAEAPATCNSTGYCSCTVSTSYADYTDSWTWSSTTWSSIPNARRFEIEAYFEHPNGCDCGCGENEDLETYWLYQCGWCTDDSDCTGDGGCASFTCNNATGYCELDDSTFEVELSSGCDLEFCVAKQCSSDSSRSGSACYATDDCPGGQCVSSTCDSGSGEGQLCYRTEVDRRRATGADFEQSYLYACYAGGGSCVEGTGIAASSVAAYPVCDDNDPCTADFCQRDLPPGQMCRHEPQACGSDESKTGNYISLAVLGALALALIGSGVAISMGRR